MQDQTRTLDLSTGEAQAETDLLDRLIAWGQDHRIL